MFVILVVFFAWVGGCGSCPSEGWVEGSVASMLYLVQHYGVLCPEKGVRLYSVQRFRRNLPEMNRIEE